MPIALTALTIRIMLVQVTFQSEAEWSAELGALLDDLTATDGPNAGRVNLWVAEDAPSYPSWCKLYAVYGAAFTRDTQTNSRHSRRARVTGEAFTHSREKSDTERGPDGRAVYKNPMLPVLRAKLERERGAPNISTNISAMCLGPHSRRCISGDLLANVSANICVRHHLVARARHHRHRRRSSRLPPPSRDVHGLEERRAPTTTYSE